MTPSGDHSLARVSCPSCHRLTTTTIAHAYTITVVDGRTGATSQRVLGGRFCLACGGGDKPDASDSPRSDPSRSNK